jgi:hypothetical protein
MRKMKKFSAGGAQGRYDRRMADIEKDFAKASKGKTGRAAEVAAAKRDQRIADAKDDLAKRTGADRTQTRAAEKSAERNLSMTRKFGAMKSAVKADDVAKVPEAKAPETKPAAPEKKAEPKSFGEAFRAARSSMGAGKTFTWQGKSYSTNRAGEGKPAAGGKGKPAAGGKGKPQDTGGKGTPPAGLPKSFSQTSGTINLAAPKTEAAKSSGITFGRADVPKPRQLTERERMERMTQAFGAMRKGMAEGGTVKKKSTPPKPTPPQPSAEERKAGKRQNESFSKIKRTDLTPGDVRTLSGMKAGGKAKMADKAGRALKKKAAAGRAMMKKAGGGKCYAKGGSVSARADGCATKGKTKGKMV